MADPTLPGDSRGQGKDPYNAAERLADEKLTGKPTATTDTSSGSDSKQVDQQERDGSVPASNESKPGWRTKVEANSKIKAAGKLIGLRKKGPLAFILALILGGGAGALFFLAPGIGIVQLKEVMVNDLNDQLASIDTRTGSVFKSKLKGMQSGAGVCTGVKINCKFTSISEKQLKKYTRAGFKVETTKNSLGRHVISSISFPDNPDGSPGHKVTDPAGLYKHLKGNPAGRSQLNKVFNPKLQGFVDNTANKFYGRMETTINKILKGKTKEDLDKEVNAATAGDKAGAPKRITVGEGDDAKEVYETSDGKQVDVDSEEGKAITKATSTIDSVADGAAKAGGSVLKGGARAISAIGIADTACTVYNTSRAIAATSKVIRNQQLIQYSMIYMNTADSIKAGDATQEEVNYATSKLASVDMNKTISSTDGSDTQVENPDYGKSGYDAEGYKLVAYGDTNPISPRASQFTVGGGLTGDLSSINAAIAENLGGAPKSICPVVQNWAVRGASLIAGIIIGIGTAGVGTALLAAGSIAVSFALPLLEGFLADMLAGKTVDSNTEGIDTVNATVVGGAGTMGGIAQARGLSPLTNDTIGGYMARSAGVRDEYIAAEVYDAQNEPLNIYNPNSFVGKFASSLSMQYLENSNSVASLIGSLPSFFSKAVSGVIPKSSAAKAYDPKRFQQCTDEGYKELNIAADIFCNIRFGLTDVELAMDTEVVVDWMVANKQISPTTGAATSGSEYATYIKNCIERVDGFGETSDAEGSPDVGASCVSQEQKYQYFRVYTIDKSIDGAMDEDAEKRASSITERPEDTDARGNGWTLRPGVDYSQYECDSRTEDLGTYTNPELGFTIRLCLMSAWPSSTGAANIDSGYSNVVSSLISTNLSNMFEAAAGDGVTMGVSDGMRSSANPDYSSYSQHGRGLAVDIGAPIGGSTICFSGGFSDSRVAQCRTEPTVHGNAFRWLEANAAQYGFQMLQGESWHWSTGEI